MSNASDSAHDQGPMPPETLDALKGSIAKWEAIVAGTGGDDGTDNCPLCLRFHAPEGHDEDCEDCPVRAASGRRYCSGTPYVRWGELTSGQSWPKEVCTPEERAAAQAELDFLKSLLPSEAKSA